MAARAPLQAPAALRATGTWLRAATSADRPFLEQLYRLVRWDEFAAAGWPDEVRTAFLATQFEFQQRHYANAFEAAEYYVIDHAQGPIGRLYVDRTTPELRLIEISLMPQWRGRGLGGALLGLLQDEVRAGRARCVRLQVAEGNPAHALYRRLGFVDLPPPDEFPRASRDMVWPAGQLAG
jgi:ribosomal protein S18 acetylase RimI-like enzyme